MPQLVTVRAPMPEVEKRDPIKIATAVIVSVTTLILALVGLREAWQRLFPESTPPQVEVGQIAAAPEPDPVKRPPDPPPALASGEATLRNGFVNFDQSGFNFRDNHIVRWDSAQGDILASRPNDSFYIQFFLPHDSPPYEGDQDKRAVSGIQRVHANYASVNNCPTTGYVHHFQVIQVDAVYCLRLRSGDAYAKIYVNNLSQEHVTFDWQLIR